MIALNNVILITGKAILLGMLAPLVSGVIRKIKNNLRMRSGPSIFQPYHNVRKLFSKGEVISRNVSWIFYAAPVIVFASSVCSLLMILMVQPGPSMKNDMAILVAVFFVLGLSRFFLALAGLDAGSSFGGIGSSREMFISSFAEPTAFIAVFVLCMAGPDSLRISGILAGFAIFMVAIAETARIPIDNQETHLELTMVHEAMVLEYSGRSLALIELAGHIKQIILFILLSWYFFAPLAAGYCEWLIFTAKIAVISLVIACIEISMAKMRLFRVVDFLTFSFFIALVASIAAGMGL